MTTSQKRQFLQIKIGALFHDQDWHLYRKDGEFNATLLDIVPGKNVLRLFQLGELVYEHNSGCAKKMPEDYLANSPSQEIPLSPSQPCALPYPRPTTVQKKPACMSCGGVGEYINGNKYKYCSNCRKRPSVRKSLSDAERGEALQSGSRRIGFGDHEQQAASFQAKHSLAHETLRASSERASGLEAVAAEPRVSNKGLGPFAHDRRRFGFKGEF